MALSERPMFVFAAPYMSYAAHAFAIMVAVLVLVWIMHFERGASLHSRNTNLIINVHTLLMCLGFILVAGEGIMAYNTVPAVKRVQKIVHMTLHFIALALGISGVCAAFKYHNVARIPHLFTLHSWLGICTISLFALQWLFGFVSFMFPGAPLPTRRMVAPYHRASGLAVFLMMVCTAETGFMQRGGLGPGVETRVINFAGFFVLLFAVTVTLTAALPKLML